MAGRREAMRLHPPAFVSQQGRLFLSTRYGYAKLSPAIHTQRCPHQIVEQSFHPVLTQYTFKRISPINTLARMKASAPVEKNEPWGGG